MLRVTITPEDPDAGGEYTFTATTRDDESAGSVLDTVVVFDRGLPSERRVSLVGNWIRAEPVTEDGLPVPQVAVLDAP